MIRGTAQFIIGFFKKNILVLDPQIKEIIQDFLLN